LTHTLYLGEKLPDGWDLHWMSGTRATLRNAGWSINTHKYRVDLPMAVDRREPDFPFGTYGFEGMMPGEDMPGDVGAINTGAAEEDEPAFPKLTLAPPTAPGGPGNPLWVGGFGSSHASGANFACGDGSVRLLSNDTDQKVLARLANRRDGQMSRAW
jgi:hypothetical protein